MFLNVSKKKNLKPENQGFADPIEENQPDATLLNVDIKATDPDTTADLYFTINWDLSYATKYSRRINDEAWNDYIGFLDKLF